MLLATDHSQSIIGEIVDSQTNTIGYSAYGEQSAQQKVETRLGFNGQLREASFGWYLLGNGYRAYNPRLLRFHSPDSWSPFGGGGLNAYMYCVGDPVNRSDPTGHWGVLALFSRVREIGTIGYVTSTLGSSMNLASLIAGRGQLTLANGLGTISGMTGMAAGLATIFDFAPQASQVLSATSVITGAASTYLGTRSIQRLVRHAGWYEAPFSRPRGSPPDYFDLYPRRASIEMPSSPPPYPLNRSTLLPASAGEKPPSYSRQDPSLFSTSMPDAGNSRNLLSVPDPIGVFGTPPPGYQTRLRLAHRNRMDGLSTSSTIRQRK